MLWGFFHHDSIRRELVYMRIVDLGRCFQVNNRKFEFSIVVLDGAPEVRFPREHVPVADERGFYVSGIPESLRHARCIPEIFNDIYKLPEIPGVFAHWDVWEFERHIGEAIQYPEMADRPYNLAVFLDGFPVFRPFFPSFDYHAGLGGRLRAQDCCYRRVENPIPLVEVPDFPGMLVLIVTDSHLVHIRRI